MIDQQTSKVSEKTSAKLILLINPTHLYKRSVSRDRKSIKDEETRNFSPPRSDTQLGTKDNRLKRDAPVRSRQTTVTIALLGLAERGRPIPKHPRQSQYIYIRVVAIPPSLGSVALPPTPPRCCAGEIRKSGIRR